MRTCACGKPCRICALASDCTRLDIGETLLLGFVMGVEGCLKMDPNFDHLCPLHRAFLNQRMRPVAEHHRLERNERLAKEKAEQETSRETDREKRAALPEAVRRTLS